MIQLRKYQNDAVDGIFTALEKVNSTLLVAPVGAGKTIMQAAFIERSISLAPRCRFVCTVHTRELVQQNMQAMLRAWPGAPVGLNSAALGRRDTRSQILFCSIQSVYKKARHIGWTDCLIVDECHLISRNSSTMYQKLIEDLRAINPQMVVIGMSGTPYRIDSGLLTDGDDALFKSVAYEIHIRDLIEQGYLTKPISKATVTGFDLSDVQIRGGEYVAGDLERAVNVADVTLAAVSEIIKFGQDRKSWIVFCAGVQHAAAVRDEFIRQGISAATVEGGTEQSERASLIRRFKAGEIRCLTNVNVLSVGFDHPAIDLVALMRPTKSAALYVQQVGRGLRLSPGKENALILDFASNIRTLGPIDMVQPPRKGKGSGDAPTKTCPKCEEIVHISCVECTDCGHVWERVAEEKPKHDAQAEGEVGILSTEKVAPTMLPVVDWRVQRHEKFGSPDSVRVTYLAGIMEYREWVAFEHGGYASQKACQWWTNHGGRTPFPKSTAEALERFQAGEISMPATISVRPNGKYHDIIGRTFAKNEVAA